MLNSNTFQPKFLYFLAIQSHCTNITIIYWKYNPIDYYSDRYTSYLYFFYLYYSIVIILLPSNGNTIGEIPKKTTILKCVSITLLLVMTCMFFRGALIHDEFSARSLFLSRNNGDNSPGISIYLLKTVDARIKGKEW